MIYICKCPGWLEMVKQHEEYNCKPSVNSEGAIYGCDAEIEDSPIKYCPWCGRTMRQET